MTYRLSGVCLLAFFVAGCNQYKGLPDTPVSPTVAAAAIPAPPPPDLASVLITQRYVNGGGSADGTVLLTGPAAAPGVTVSLSVNDEAATVDPAVTIPAGASSAAFVVSTRAVAQDRQIVVTASTRSATASSSFAVWGEVPVFFNWTSETGDFIGQAGIGRMTLQNAMFTGRCDANYLMIDITQGSDRWSAAFSGPAGVPLRPGAYEGATRWPFNSATPGLSISGRGRGCNMLGGRFVIHDIDLQNNRINRFHASLVQRCDNGAGLFTGEIRVANLSSSSSAAACLR